MGGYKCKEELQWYEICVICSRLNISSMVFILLYLQQEELKSPNYPNKLP